MSNTGNLCGITNEETDTETMLETAITLFYHNRSKTITDVKKIIQDYCVQDQTSYEYDKVLKTVHNLINDLPSNILLYFLTTIPLPKLQGEYVSCYSDVMKRTRASMSDSIKPILIQFLKNAMPPLVAIELDKNETDKEEVNNSTETNNTCESSISNGSYQTMPAPITKDASTSESSPEIQISCMSLLDICADFVVLNLRELQEYYDIKSQKVWGVINKACTYEIRTECYKLIEDLNKKINLLRMIQSGYISVDVIKEQYGSSDVFLKEQALMDIIDEDAFTVSDELRDAVNKFIYH